MVQANLIIKTDFDAKLSSLNRKITNNKTKHLRFENKLTMLENKIPDVSSLVEKTDYSTKVAEIDGKISRLDDKINKNIVEGVKKLIPYMSRSIFDAEDGTQAYLIFQPIHKCIKITADTKFISELKFKGLSDENIKLFGAVTLTENANITKHKNSGYGIGFDRRSNYSFPGGGYGQNVLIFGADMNSSPHIDNKKRYISYWKRTKKRIRTYFNCRKNVFH